MSHEPFHVVRRIAKVGDASKPVDFPPRDIHGVAGYIGGDTPHVWTDKDWQKFADYRKLPIFVRSQTVGYAGGRADAFDALQALFALGVPHHSAVVYDRETNLDKEATQAFGDVMHWANYTVWPYGSKDNLFSHPALDGYFVADPTNVPHMYTGHSDVMMTQYLEDDGRGFDESEIRLWQFENHMMQHWSFRA